MAETPEDAVSNGEELKRVLVGKIVRKLKDSLDHEQEAEEDIQDKSHLLNQADETADKQQMTQEDRTNEGGDHDLVTNHLREQGVSMSSYLFEFYRIMFFLLKFEVCNLIASAGEVFLIIPESLCVLCSS